jgi:hypothetical protein
MRSQSFSDGPLCEDFFVPKPELRASAEQKMTLRQLPLRDLAAAGGGLPWRSATPQSAAGTAADTSKRLVCLTGSE